MTLFNQSKTLASETLLVFSPAHALKSNCLQASAKFWDTGIGRQIANAVVKPSLSVLMMQILSTGDAGPMMQEMCWFKSYLAYEFICISCATAGLTSIRMNWRVSYQSLQGRPTLNDCVLLPSERLRKESEMAEVGR